MMHLRWEGVGVRVVLAYIGAVRLSVCGVVPVLLCSAVAAAADSPAVEQALRKGTHVDKVLACPDKHVQLLEVTHDDAPAAPKAVAVATQDGGSWSVDEKVHFRDGEESNTWGGCRQVAGRLIYWMEYWSVSPDSTQRGDQRQVRGLSIFAQDGAGGRQVFSLSGTPKGKVDVTESKGKGLIISIGGKKVAEPTWEELSR
jgi:hypothetical protein